MAHQVDRPVSSVARRDIGRRTALCLHLTILPLQVELESHLHLVLVTSAVRQGTGQRIAFLLTTRGGRQ